LFHLRCQNMIKALSVLTFTSTIQIPPAPLSTAEASAKAVLNYLPKPWRKQLAQLPKLLRKRFTTYPPLFPKGVMAFFLCVYFSMFKQLLFCDFRIAL
jgi:hypothetical protein